jgi:hypothetical protein
MSHKRLSRLNRESHGMSRTPAWNAWSEMRCRCLNPKHRVYPSHGGRGITVCDKWLLFTGLYEDMGDPPEGHSLERKDNDGPYSKDNCVWATVPEQNRNRRSTRFIEFQGETQGETRTIREWNDHLGYPRNLIWQRLETGWLEEAALTTPPGGKKP